MAGPLQPELSERAHGMYTTVLDELTGSVVSDLEKKFTEIVRTSDLETIKKEFPYDDQHHYIPGLRNITIQFMNGGQLIEQGLGSERYEIRGPFDTKQAIESLDSAERDYLKRVAQRIIV